MTTVAQAVQEAKALLYSTARVEQNRLTAALDASVTLVTFTYPLRGIVPGAKFTIDEEMFYVWSTSDSGGTAVVERGFLGTTAASHAAGTIIDVDPPFPVHTIKDQLRKEIISWPTDVFAVGAVELEASNAYMSQGIDTGIEGDWWHILDIRHAPNASRGYVNNTWSQISQYEVQRNAPVASFASGSAIIFNQQIPSGIVSVIYSKPFDTSTWSDATDLESDVGLLPSMLDIPVLGVCWRLAAFREVKRTFDEAQGESRHADEVPAGTASRAGEYFRAIRNRRIGEEAARLVALYPRRYT